MSSAVTHPTGRALAPDLARGVMLALIVTSNTMFYLYAAEHGATGWHPMAETLADRIAQFLMITLLDLRVYPLFAFLFGYGMVQFLDSRTGVGLDPLEAKRMLRRRSLWLIVFGAIHAGLLMAGDILGAYGVMSLIIGWLFLLRSNRVVLAAATVAVMLLIVLLGLSIMGYLAGQAPPAIPPTVEAYASGESDYLAATLTRLRTWLGVTLGGGLLGFAFHAAMLLGMWAARRRILEAPEHHRRLLISVACIGVPVAFFGGLPTALGHLGLIDVPDRFLVIYGPAFYLQMFSGLFGGLAYAAILALLAARLSQRRTPGLPARLAVATGRRSLSSYLAFSVAFSPLLALWGLGLGAHLGSATMIGFALSVWLLVAAVNLWFDQRRLRGPAEVALRALSRSNPA